MDDPNYGLPPEVKKYLDDEFAQIDQSCTRLKTQSRDDLPKEGNIPRLLFHYTNAEATKNILTSKSLWATHAQFLSDRTEFRYGINLARDLLSKRAIEPNAAFYDLAVKLLDDPTFEPYVVSFSSDCGKRLSQWMIYGDGGAGFSIGFDYKRLRRHFGSFAGVLPVTYDLEVHEQILTTEIDSYEKVCEKAIGNSPDLRGEIETYCSINLVSLLGAECTAFKHPGFKEEQEFRIVARRLPGCPEPKFRSGKFGVTPYVVLESPDGQKLPVERVFLGPTADRQSAEEGIKMLLAELDYQGVEVDVSYIPQR